MSAMRSLAAQPRPRRLWRLAAAALLLAILCSCSAIREFPQNVRTLNDGFGSPQLDHHTRVMTQRFLRRSGR